MVKSKKIKRLGNKVKRPVPLADQITSDDIAKPSRRIKAVDEEVDNHENIVDGALGRNIIKQSWAQIQEINNEEKDDEEWPALGTTVEKTKPKKCSVDVSLTKGKFQKKVQNQNAFREDRDSEGEVDIDETETVTPVNVDSYVNSFERDLDLDREDVDILEHFKNKNADPQRRLADLFRDKITEKQTEIQTEIDVQSAVGGSNLSPEIQSMCHEIGKVLARYRSGPLPKSFKAFPNMKCWEELIYLTKPDKWTAAAMYQATRIFISNLRASMAQRFLNLVLLPRIRDDISFYKRLNYHLYEALSKALFKSSAFFKGILLPLCNSGDCTLREAIVIGSAIAKNHIPIDNSAAAIMKIASMDYSGANSIFLRIFFDKKYALPYQVLDECCDHFKRFEREARVLPVLWHQSLLSFVQRYKNDISQDQKDDLLRLVNFHTHHKVTSEIRRELFSSTSRDESMNIAD